MSFKNLKNETSRMLKLANYGITENAKKNSAPTVDFKVKAANGLTYGIVNEGSKFYIKVAPKKDTEILNEDFDYINGFNNRKAYEYKSYSEASKNLDMLMYSINESHKSNKVIIEHVKKSQPNDWQMLETKEVRAEIERMNQISKNVNDILTEGEIKLPSYLKENTENKPYTEEGKYEGDKLTKDSEEDHEKPNGSPYQEDGEAILDKPVSPKTDSECNNVYCEEPSKEVKDSVANSNNVPSKPLIKPVLGNKVLKLTEEQVLSWLNDNEYMDTSNGTEIGDGDPYNELVSEENIPSDEAAGFDGLEDEDDVPFPEVEGDELDEDIENMFGKHPAYQKEPMDIEQGTPKYLDNTEVWDDDSVDSLEPYGTKIGDGSPYEELVQTITDSIMSKMGF